MEFNDEELNSSIESITSLSPKAFDCTAYKALLKESAHLSHKDWAVTEGFGDKLGALCDVESEDFHLIFKRVLEGGNWQGALDAKPSSGKPWVVLVSGLNGIRKTTAIYQPWFRTLLAQAISPGVGEMQELPQGNNSFFRQLDYMLAVLANHEFKALYRDCSAGDVALYSERKANIFKRYRMLAEMLGIYLMKQCKQRGMNVMVETSGRDVASFKYIEHVFPDTSYNKLVLYFTINDIKFAEASVDRRMLKEMAEGAAALASGDTHKVIEANAGGPYGSAVLPDVQRDSQAVWKSVVDGSAGVGDGWYRASICICAKEDEAWTACADRNEQQYTFVPLSELQ